MPAYAGISGSPAPLLFSCELNHSLLEHACTHGYQPIHCTLHTVALCCGTGVYAVDLALPPQTMVICAFVVSYQPIIIFHACRRPVPSKVRYNMGEADLYLISSSSNLLKR